MSIKKQIKCPECGQLLWVEETIGKGFFRGKCSGAKEIVTPVTGKPGFEKCTFDGVVRG